jgi:predicted permease
MFIGHFAPALLARGITEDAPKLGVLFIAAQLVDWAFFTFAIFGIEQLRIVPGITAMNPYDLVFMP